MNKIIHLTSRSHSVIVKIDRVPEIIHWGNKISHLDDDLLHAIQRPISQARLDVDVPLSLCPELGSGYFNAPGIDGHRDGRDWAPVFTLVDYQQGAHDVVFDLQDEQAQLHLQIELALDYETDVLKTRSKVMNIGTKPYHLHNLTNTLPVSHRATELMSFHGRWSREFQTQRQAFQHGGFIQENRRGRTSHENFPGLFVGSNGFSEQCGKVWAFHLGWSGNHRIRAEVKSDGRRFVQAGELLLAGEQSLSANESYTTPWLYACHSDSGLNGVSERFQHYVREQIIRFPTAKGQQHSKPRPVHLNTWEGIYFQHDPQYIMQMATQAAEIGVERFIIDDGWFIGRDGEKTALGDWYLDEVKYPQGLEPVIEHVNQQGMEFGLWVEPEMISKDSNLYREHPEWLLELSGYQQPSGRWQYVLNLQNPACFDYLFARLNDLLSTYNIAYLKWDMNREMVQPGHEGLPAVHGQTQALYRLIDKLVSAHPSVDIESCSSGGGRIDFEILKRTHRFWTSDCNDALERQTIQKGMSYFFPPEVMGSHIGPKVSHTTRRTHHINMRGVTALSGHMGVELDPVKESSEEKHAFARYISLHKKYRDLLHSGTAFRIDSLTSAQNIYGVRNKDQILVTVCQLTMPDYALPAPLLIDCVEEDARYLVKVVEVPESSFQLMKRLPTWLHKPVTLTGSSLKEIGLAMPILDPEAAMMLHLQKIK